MKKLTVLVLGVFLVVSALAFSGCAKKAVAPKKAPKAPVVKKVPTKKVTKKVTAKKGMAKKTAAPKAPAAPKSKS